MIETPQLYTPAEVADILKVTRRCVYNYMADEKLVSLKVGRYRRITAESLQAFLNAQISTDKEKREKARAEK